MTASKFSLTSIGGLTKGVLNVSTTGSQISERPSFSGEAVFSFRVSSMNRALERKVLGEPGRREPILALLVPQDQPMIINSILWNNKETNRPEIYLTDLSELNIEYFDVK